MFRNLEAEQARRGYTNADMAQKLDISRVSYESKKKTGKNGRRNRKKVSAGNFLRMWR